MTEQDQRIALSEFEGWKQLAPYKCGNTVVDWPVFEKDGERASVLTNTLPNYPNDLNAVHELEKKVPDSYWDELGKITGCDHNWAAEGADCIHWKDFAHATASQRCEALLRTLNLWKD